MKKACTISDQKKKKHVPSAFQIFQMVILDIEKQVCNKSHSLVPITVFSTLSRHLNHGSSPNN